MKIFGAYTSTLSLLCFEYDLSNSTYQQPLHLQYHVITVAASDTPYQAQIIYPEYGAILFNRLKIELQTNVSLYDQLVLQIAGLPDTVVPSNMQTIESQDDSVEPGSWFYSITPLSTHSGRDLYGIPSVGGNTIDGLRSVWLQQSEFMDSNRFAFTWILAAEATTQQSPPSKYTLRVALRNLSNYNHNVFVQDTAGFALQLNDLHEIPNDGSSAAVYMWAGNTTNLYLYAHQRWRVANRDIDAMSPPWCKRMYENMRLSLLTAGCKVAVYGNDRHFGANVVIIDTARTLNITSVGELSNHIVHPLTVPDVLVAPSEFAAHHPSIQELLESVAANNMHNTGVTLVVISPSVNTDTLRPPLPEERSNAKLQQQLYRHLGCVVTGTAPINRSPCIVIGFLARLSKEKSPGLFLQMAVEILQNHPFARFTIIGDGPLRAHLENLADRLKISWAVHFTGWASAADLPGLLAGLDIVVNPFLWPETFCIANIEVMSMGVPLVTFAVGGIGEYVQDPALSHRFGDGMGNTTQTETANPDTQADFSVSRNAVVVNRATHVALARAAMHLIQRPSLRRALGITGRQTVFDHFKVTRQMQEYSRCYDSLKI
eukprot:gene9477-11152_t